MAIVGAEPSPLSSGLNPATRTVGTLPSTPTPSNAGPWRFGSLVAALVALVPFFAVTVDGIGVAPDSTQYRSAARSLLAGHGLRSVWWNWRPEPLTHFPPLYPATLALIGRLTGADPVAVAWWLALVLVAANVLIVGWLAALAARQALGASPLTQARVATVAALFAALSKHMQAASAMALSDSLFVTLVLLSLGALAIALESERIELLLLSAALAALSTLTRSVGVTLTLSGAIAVP